jgi:hypothetical protein
MFTAQPFTVQCDSKLLSGFPWVIIFKSKKHNKIDYGIWKCNSKSFVLQRYTRRIDVWENIWRHTSKWWLSFFETKSVIKTQRRYRTQYGKVLSSDNAIRRSLKQFQETDSVLYRKGAGRPSTWRGIEYRLDILRAMKGAHVEVI